jgi:hypothetical protein
MEELLDMVGLSSGVRLSIVDEDAVWKGGRVGLLLLRLVCLGVAEREEEGEMGGVFLVGVVDAMAGLPLGVLDDGEAVITSLVLSSANNESATASEALVAGAPRRSSSCPVVCCCCCCEEEEEENILVGTTFPSSRCS